MKPKIGLILQTGFAITYLYILIGTDIIHNLWIDETFKSIFPLVMLNLVVFSWLLGIISAILNKRFISAMLKMSYIAIIAVMCIILTITMFWWGSNNWLLFVILNIISLIPGLIIVIINLTASFFN